MLSDPSSVQNFVVMMWSYQSLPLISIMKPSNERSDFFWQHKKQKTNTIKKGWNKTPPITTTNTKTTTRIKTVKNSYSTISQKGFAKTRKSCTSLFLLSLFRKPAIYAHYELYIIVELLAINVLCETWGLFKHYWYT